MKKKEIENIFPLSNQKGSPAENINTALMNEMARKNKKLTDAELEKILIEHLDFIVNGGIGGKWETLLTSGLVFGIYTGAKAKSGKQADFYQKCLSNFDLSWKKLATANFIGSVGEKVNASYSNFENAIFTDSCWKNSNFEYSDLRKVDFSRGDFSYCNFRYCNLQETDFENCNLTGADFTGAYLKNSRFPGAILKNVKYNMQPKQEDTQDGETHSLKS